MTISRRHVIAHATAWERSDHDGGSALNDKVFGTERSEEAVVHIVPSLVPGACGVGDYAVRVANGLLAQGVQSRFVVCGVELLSRSAENDARGPFAIDVIETDLSAGLAKTLRANRARTILVHYTGNGYDPFGSPRWLAKVLDAHRRRSDVRVVTFFHETWQAPSLFSRRLYRTLFQRRVVRQMSALSDAIITNTRQRVADLSHQHDRCIYLPVFSNIGERMDSTVKSAGNSVIFGLPARRQQTWEALARSPHLLDALGVRTIADIGPGPISIPKQLHHLAITYGSLPSEQVSEIMAGASTAFIHYDNAQLGKSGILAAFAAHRLCVVNLNVTHRMTRRADVTAGVHYLLPSQVAGEVAVDLRSVAAALTNWYRPHSFDANVAVLSRVLER